MGVASAPDLIGDRYEVVRPLGQGSFGHTYLARDRRLGRMVALKRLDARAHRDTKVFEMFQREAEVLAALRHHGIPEIFETLQSAWDGVPAAILVMEHVDGESLANIIDTKRPLD